MIQPAPAKSPHERQEGFAHEHWPVQVDVHETLPEVEVEIVPGRSLEDPGVVDQDVDVSEFVGDASSRRASIEDGLLMSSVIVTAGWPVVAMSARFAVVTVIAVNDASSACSARPTAMACPMPREAPVTSATRPVWGAEVLVAGMALSLL